MRLAHNRADHLGRFDGFMGRVPAHAVHEPQDPPLHRLEPVARIRNRPRIRADPIFRIRVLNRRRKFFPTNLLGIESHQKSEVRNQKSEVRRQMATRILRMYVLSIRLISSRSLQCRENASTWSMLRSRASKSWYSSSVADPIAICRNLASSLRPSRPQPSAILLGIDAHERRI